MKDLTLSTSGKVTDQSLHIFMYPLYTCIPTSQSQGQSTVRNVFNGVKLLHRYICQPVLTL